MPCLWWNTENLKPTSFDDKAFSLRLLHLLPFVYLFEFLRFAYSRFLWFFFVYNLANMTKQKIIRLLSLFRPRFNIKQFVPIIISIYANFTWIIVVERMILLYCNLMLHSLIKFCILKAAFSSKISFRSNKSFFRWCFSSKYFRRWTYPR